MGTAGMFALQGVVKRYGGQVALEVDLEIARGGVTVLLGPSGSGKSTLLRLLVGLLAPDGGEVRFDGRPLHADLVGSRRRMGYVIQDGGLFPHLTAAENVLLPARAAEREQARSRLGELASLVRLPEALLARYPIELSGGQRQRVALMRALILDPEALLLDEPLSALDPIVRADLRTDLRRIVSTLGKTAVVVTHDLADAAVLADDVVLLRGGRIVQRGPLAALVRAPADPFVTRFIESQHAHLPEPGPETTAGAR